ncbi:DUF4910 domain-containing protein [Desulfobacter latus]|uniref:DUF4910 domain-containing protein n=1 Tax=Desulfobacter latus TaxID=2292 RepID=A0A850SZV3_9BACT|nr:DUF4910 domain-containing protein [Desulfobacter latus]NWH04973.1 DUF4910 domain-containing protein [Desulfobacter latus]
MNLKNEMDIIERYYLYNRVGNSDGFAASIQDLQQHIDLEIQNYEPGTRICHWEIPQRWYLDSAGIYDTSGKPVWDLTRHPLAVWAYSQPFSGTLRKTELKQHVFTNPSHPTRIPFRFHMMFRHWEKDWGFSMPHQTFEALADKTYNIIIKSRFTKEPMQTFTYESKGKSKEVVLIVAHWCHPGQANDGLSGAAVGIKLIDELKKKNHYYTYRFIGVPELIGSMAYLDLLTHSGEADALKAVLGLNFLGHKDSMLLFKSIRNRSRLDDYLYDTLINSGISFQSLKFKELVDTNPALTSKKNGIPPVYMGGGTGDEAPFEAPGFAIPTTALTRKTPYPEYHTDADNPSFVSLDHLSEARAILMSAIDILEQDWIPIPKFKGLPCLSHPEINLFKRPLRESGMPRKDVDITPEIDYHQLSTYIIYDFDQKLSVFELSRKYNLPFNIMKAYLEQWEVKGLLKRSRCPMIKHNVE